jgi:hypothetical protein
VSLVGPKSFGGIAKKRRIGATTVNGTHAELLKLQSECSGGFLGILLLMDAKFKDFDEA